MKRGLIVIAAASAAAGCSVGLGPGDAYRACERAVETQLVSPGSADYSGASGSDIEQDGDSYTVRGYVDSQNSFGASLRSTFRCELRDTGDNFDLVDLSVG